MKASDLVLNIAANLERLSRWSGQGNTKRIEQFLVQTDDYVSDLKEITVSERFKRTRENFEKDFEELKKSQSDSSVWAEKALTWANILTHRAKLA